jgi:ATP-binding cassette subfamily C protein/ATP-binding cassette subfamily C protein LapB
MILVWRALSPMQVAFVMLTRVDQLRKSVTQINRLFDFPPEQAEGILLASAGGHIEFSQVMFKYPGETDPVVSNLSMVASRGDLVAIVGKNGAGKSSVLKLISGLYPPLVGRIRIDNCDIRQIQPRQLRQLISYVPQSPQFFHGSVYDNLLMSQPMATRDEIIAALDDAGAWEEIKKFPQQIDTFLDVRQNEFFPSSLVMRIALARVYLRQSPIVLFDEPITGLDFESEFLFTSALEQMRQTSTIFLVTHRPSHLRIANKILLLEGGVCRYFGPAAEVRDKISAQLI